jgi:hypothetical protein
MRRRKFIVLGAATVGIVLVLFCLASRHQEPVIATGFSSSNLRRWGNLYVDRLSLLWVTNKAGFAIVLDSQEIQLGQQARIVKNLGSMWDGKSNSISLPPNAALPLTFEVPGEFDRFRVRFHYSWSGGSLRAAISRGVRKLPPKLMPQRLQTWLRANGFWDGWFRREFESPWIPSKQLQ